MVFFISLLAYLCILKNFTIPEIEWLNFAVILPEVL